MAAVPDIRERYLSVQQKADMINEVKRMAKQRPDGVIPRDQWFSVYLGCNLGIMLGHRNITNMFSNMPQTTNTMELPLHVTALEWHWANRRKKSKTRNP